MRSLRYLLGGKPRNSDDCLDFSRRETPLEVSLTLNTEEIVIEHATR